PKPTTFLPVGGRFLDIWAGLTLVSLVHGLVRLKAVGRRRLATHLLEFMLAKGHQLLELGCDCGTVNECQDLFHLEIKNVAGIVQQAKRTKPLSDFYENAAHTSEYACPFEAQIFPRADSRASVLENPREDQTTERMAAQFFADPLLCGSNATGFRVEASPVRNPEREFANAPQQERGIIVQRRAFEF